MPILFVIVLLDNKNGRILNNDIGYILHGYESGFIVCYDGDFRTIEVYTVLTDKA